MLASVVIVMVAFVWLLIFSLMTSAKRADEEAERLLAELVQDVALVYYFRELSRGAQKARRAVIAPADIMGKAG